MHRVPTLAACALMVLATAACERDRSTAGSSTAGAASTSPQSAPVAAEREVDFVVEGMHCATCPITVRTAAKAVAGVVDAQVTMDPGRARVRFRPAETDPARIAAAITDSGYPAHEAKSP